MAEPMSEIIAPQPQRAGQEPASAAPADGAVQPSMNEVSKLYRRSSQFLGGQIALFLLGFVSFPILARMFSVAEFGLIALVQNTIAVAVVFSKSGLQHAVQRFYKENAVSKAPGALRRYYSSLFFGAAGAGLAITLIFLLSLWLLPHKLVSPALQRLLGYASALIFIRSVQSMISNLLQAEGKAKAFTALQLGTKAATIALTVLLLVTWQTTPTVFFVGMILVEASIVLLMLPYLRRRRILAAGGFDRHLLRVAMAFGLPMMATEICWLILDSGDRFLVQGFLGARALGYYAAAYNISSYIRDALSAPVYLALFPICMELWIIKGKQATQEFLSRLMDHFILAGVGLVCAVSVVARDAIHILASPKFLESHRLLPYLLIGQVISAVSMFPRISLLIHKRTLAMVRAVFLGGLLNILLDIFLLPRLGLLGAAIGTLGAYMFSTLLFTWESQRLLPLKMRWAAWTRYVVVGAASWTIVSQLTLEKVYVDLAIKGAMSLTLYFGTLWLVDQKVRDLADVFFRTLFGFRTTPELT